MLDPMAAVRIEGSTSRRAGARLVELATALAMTVGRGAAARTVADMAEVGPSDHVIDVGCGPGTAVREAVRRGATGTGVDPSPLMLGLAGWISRARGLAPITWSEGTAEAIPVADGYATVAWALSSVHHWTDRAAGLAELHRVLVPGGRVLLLERLTWPGATGHATHGLTPGAARDLAAQLADVGFEDVRVEIRKAGRRPVVTVRGTS